MLALTVLSVAFIIPTSPQAITCSTPTQDITCRTPTDCNACINMTAGLMIRAWGYMSAAKGGHLSSTGGSSAYIYCHGASSCKNVLSIKTTNNRIMEMYGTAAAQYVPSIGVGDNRAFCYGSNSCCYSTINVSPGCTGDQSCAYSTVNSGSASTISGGGAYSFKNATIDSINSAGTMSIQFTGYHDAYGALVICRSGHICDITCEGNSCDFLNTQCMDGNNCQFTYNRKAPQNEIHHIVLLYDSFSLTNTNNVNCNNANSLTYDDYQEHFNKPDGLIVDADMVPYVCCRGASSCQYTSVVEYNGTIICSGVDACSRVGMIKNSGDLFCEAADSCESSTIYNQNIRNVYCLGRSSCESTTITGAGNIYCSGTLGCFGASITSLGNGDNLNIYLLGLSSFREIDIYCKANDVCRIIVGVNTHSLSSANSVICEGVCIIECPSTYQYCPIGLIPTEHPTSNPTLNPTSYPTSIPTISTSNPTQNPSLLPTFLPTNEPTTEPTTEPTIEPTTVNPSLNPSHSMQTTQQYKYAIVITITFQLQHILNANESNEINDLLKDIIEAEINTKFGDETYCISDDLDTKIHQLTDTKAITNVTISVCSEHVQQTISAEFKQSLSIDFIVNEINDNSLLTVVIEKIDFENVMLEVQVSEITSTENVQIIGDPSDAHLKTNQYLLWIYVGIPMLFIVLIIIIVVTYCKRKQDSVKKYKEPQTDASTHVISVAMTQQSILSASGGEMDENTQNNEDEDLYETDLNIQETKGVDSINENDTDTDMEKDEDLYNNSDIQNTKGEELENDNNVSDEDTNEKMYENIEATKGDNEQNENNESDEELYRVVNDNMTLKH